MCSEAFIFCEFLHLKEHVAEELLISLIIILTAVVPDVFLSGLWRPKILPAGLLTFCDEIKAQLFHYDLHFIWMSNFSQLS